MLKTAMKICLNTIGMAATALCIATAVIMGVSTVAWSAGMDQMTCGPTSQLTATVQNFDSDMQPLVQMVGELEPDGETIKDMYQLWHNTDSGAWMLSHVVADGSTCVLGASANGVSFDRSLGGVILRAATPAVLPVPEYSVRE